MREQATNQEYLDRIKKIYEDFSFSLKKIEAERDEKIAEILKRIDQRQIEKIKQELK